MRCSRTAGASCCSAVRFGGSCSSTAAASCRSRSARTGRAVGPRAGRQVRRPSPTVTASSRRAAAPAAPSRCAPSTSTARLLENFVILDRGERHDKIARELDANAQRLGGRVSRVPRHDRACSHEVPDLVEYPSVVAGTFAPEFLELPEEVLTTTLIHHQHYFPVEADDGQAEARVPGGHQHASRTTSGRSRATRSAS